MKAPQEASHGTLGRVSLREQLEHKQDQSQPGLGKGYLGWHAYRHSSNVMYP